MSSIAFDNFETASRTVLAFLHQRFAFGLWMVTRTEGDDWIVLQALDRGYGVREGDVYRWADSFCSRMVEGQGPRLAPRAAAVPAYAAAPIGQRLAIGAYIGVPLVRPDGTLFGTLCAIDPREQPQLSDPDLELVELLANLLATLLAADLQAVEQQRLARYWKEASLTDALTGLANRRGWDLRLEEEEARARRYGGPVGVLVIDLDDLKEINDTQGHGEGDKLIRDSARIIGETLRTSDFAARIGGDEFAILAVESGAAHAAALAGRLEEALAADGIRASIGHAGRDPRQHLAKAWEAADQAMYAIKQERRGDHK
ncbi:MAG: sensor domain-containing diguanylate cyclase [Pseudomonadota bacterium]|nr:sensor domain-containing diguanylate cyclase [Pseudomonadota bacterium]